MVNPLLEIDGAVSEIRERLGMFDGKKLHVVVNIVQDAPTEKHQSSILQPTFTERVLARIVMIPEEELAKIPRDLADQHDHYLYGSPKN